MALSFSMVRTAADLAGDVYMEPRDWLLYRREGVAWLAIEGSDELIDWRRNLEFLITSDDTHAGFQNYATLLMAEMLASGVAFSREEHLVITGHSLGGAVATIIAAHLQEHLPLVDLVTFGSPRPGGALFRDRLRVPHHRYVHANDVVPSLPASWMGFRHTAPALQLDPTHPGHLLDGIRDHDMRAYRSLIDD